MSKICAHTHGSFVVTCPECKACWLEYNPDTPHIHGKPDDEEDEEKVFYCPDDDKEFKAVGYPNPVFYADTVANCPTCKQKCWEKTVKIAYSEYERLKKMGVKPRLAS